MSAVTTTFAVLMCHAPIVVPAVAGARAAQCARSTAAMREAARALVASRPDVTVVLSPHTPRSAGFAAVVPTGDTLAGDFAQFGAPSASVALAHGADAIARIEAHEPLARVRVTSGSDDGDDDDARARALDHGALVPLWFLHEAGWRGATVVLALPRRPTRADTERMGRALAAAAEDARWAIVASGDMSHRLIPGAPAGYDAEAPQFDASVMRALDDPTSHAVMALFDHRLRERAAEDVVDTLAIASIACGAKGRRTISYEGPFGVGYGVAVLHDDAASASEPEVSHASVSTPSAGTLACTSCVDVARDALHAHFAGVARAPAQLDDAATGVFVTWRKPDGALRGCVGRMELDGELGRVLADVAVAAATKDPRFAPVHADEIAGLSCEVTLLEPSEPARVTDLDAHEFGVEVTSGLRRGVLLPAIDGIDDVPTQLAAVMKKAGIRAGEPYALRRFRARKVKQ